MTKSSPKKVIKNLQRPTNRRGKYEVIKHFEPSKIYTACHTNLQAEIPKINANNDEKENKKQRKMLVKIPCNAPCAKFREPSPLINNLSSVQKIECQRKNTFKRNKKPPFKSSSSSSLEVDLEKFTNKKRVKSKSFHSGQPKIPAGSEKTISNFRERSLSPRLKRTSLKSVTDPVLIQKELNLKSLKQEILENKRVLASEKQKPTKNLIAYDEKGPQIQNLKDEISHSKHMSILHKKIFITELKSEIAEYKKCSNFVVYNSQSGSTPRLDNKQNSEKVLPKSPKRTSLYEDMNADKLPLEAKRCCWEIDTGEFLSGGVEQSRTGTDKESFLDTTDERF